MTDDINLPPLPKHPSGEVDWSLREADCLNTWALEAIALDRASRQPEQSGNPIPLHIIRKWPEGFEDRLQHVWLDVVSFIPDVKLYDLQRTLAEFGFIMEVREASTNAALTQPQAQQAAKPQADAKP